MEENNLFVILLPNSRKAYFSISEAVQSKYEIKF